MNWLCVQGCAVFLEGPTPQNWQEERTTLGGAREPSFLLPLLLGKALKSRRRIDRAKSSWGLAMASGGWGHLTRHPGEPRPPASPQTPGCIQGGGFQGCCSLAFLHQYGTSFLLARSSVACPRPPVSFLPGRAGSRWPGFQVTVSLRTTVPGRQSGRSALMCTQAHICLAHAPTQQALCDKPPAVPRPGVSGGCLGKSEGFGPAFLEMLYLQTLCLASASQSSINCSITPSKQL